MLNLIALSATYLFTGNRALILVKNGTNVINSTNPLILTKNITLVVVNYCMPATVQSVAHCIATGSLIAALVVSPNPMTIGSAIHVVTETYENC